MRVLLACRVSSWSSAHGPAVNQGLGKVKPKAELVTAPPGGAQILLVRTHL
jgi:hypothetical protein